VSALFIFGLSWLYGMTLDLSFEVLATLFLKDKFWSALSTGSIFAMIFFKLGLAPCHFWLPDVYDRSGAPLIVFLTSVPKVAFILVLKKVLDLLSLESAMVMVQGVLIVSASIGSLSALGQRHFQRFLGYSGLLQVSIACAPLLIVGDGSLSLSVLFIMVYFLSLCCFFYLTKETEFIDGQSISDSNKKSSVRLSLLALAGLPPSPLFFIKAQVMFYLIQHDFCMLPCVLLGASVINAYYYLLLIAQMYQEEKNCLQEENSRSMLQIDEA
jgi:NADH-quinone oxidoreductase subunit N